MTRFPVGFLTQPTHPLLPALLERFRARAPGVEPVLIFDARDFSEKDLKIFEHRTRGAFPPRPLPPGPRVRVSSHNAPDCIEEVARRSLPLLVNAGTPRLLGPALLASVPLGVVNVHPGILPKYRGASCPEWAVYHDDPVGVTAHFMDARLDAGPILFTRTLEVPKGTSYAEFRVALYQIAQDVMVEAVQMVLDRNLSARALPPQPDGVPFKPIPDDLLAVVEAKLASGSYRHAR